MSSNVDGRTIKDVKSLYLPIESEVSERRESFYEYAKTVHKFDRKSIVKSITKESCPGSPPKNFDPWKLSMTTSPRRR